MFPLVVEALGIEQSATAPILDGGCRHTELRRHLRQSEHAFLTQAIAEALEPVVPTEPEHHSRIECQPLSRYVALCVQPIGDLLVGMLIEQSINFGDHSCRCLSQS